MDSKFQAPAKFRTFSEHYWNFTTRFILTTCNVWFRWRVLRGCSEADAPDLQRP